jgi:SAM-dependent methyltransferase
MGRSDSSLSAGGKAVLPLRQALASQREAWEARPAVRALYEEWFEMITRRLAREPGPTVELGAGIGAFKEFFPDVLATDIEPTPWSEEVVDAEALPYRDASVANLVLVDTLHHIPRPRRFFSEAERVLVPGGRVVMLEPYASPVSSVALRAGHHEDFDTRVDPLADEATSSDSPLDANNATPTLIFWRRLARFAELYPGLEVVERARFAFFAYPLSGGFMQRRLLPDRAIRAVSRFETRLSRLGRLAAFRCLIVLERR